MMGNDIVTKLFADCFNKLSELSMQFRDEIEFQLNLGHFPEAQVYIQKFQVIHQFMQQLKKEEDNWDIISQDIVVPTPDGKQMEWIMNEYDQDDSSKTEKLQYQILSQLVTLGGEAKDKEIKNRFCISLSNELTDTDWQVNEKNPKLLNWQVNVDLALNSLFTKGYISKSPLRNGWEITPTGHELILNKPVLDVKPIIY